MRDVSTLDNSLAHLTSSIHDLGREAKSFFFPQTITTVEKCDAQEDEDIVHQLESEMEEPVTFVNRNFYHEEVFKAGVTKPSLEKKIVNIYECENTLPTPVIQPQTEERKFRMPVPIPRLAKSMDLSTTVLSSNDTEARTTPILSSHHTNNRSHVRDPLTEELKQVVQKRKQELSHIHNETRP